MSLDSKLSPEQNQKIIDSMVGRMRYVDALTSSRSSNTQRPPVDTAEVVADKLYRKYGPRVLGWSYNRLLEYYYRHAERLERQLETHRI